MTDSNGTQLADMVKMAKRAAGRWECPAYVVLDDYGYDRMFRVVTERAVWQSTEDHDSPDWSDDSMDDYSELECVAVVDPLDEGDTSRVEYQRRMSGFDCYPFVTVRNR